MDKQALYEKAEKALNQAFEVSKAAIQVVSEKAGDAAKITKLLIKKTALEHQISKKFTEIGSRIYERAQSEKEVSLEDRELSELIAETHRLDESLLKVEAQLGKERNRKVF